MGCTSQSLKLSPNEQKQRIEASHLAQRRTGERFELTGQRLRDLDPVGGSLRGQRRAAGAGQVRASACSPS